MLRNYLVIAWRNLYRNRLYAAVNIVGLAVGLAACLAIVLYVRFELSYDRHHSKAERIYRVATAQEWAGTVSRSAALSALAVPEARAFFPEFEAVTGLVKAHRAILRHGEDVVAEARFAYADTHFFRLFDVPFRRGGPGRVLDEANTVALSASTAQRYFGAGDALGRTIELEVYGERADFRVAGVYEDFPAGSHLQLDGLISMRNVYATAMEWWAPFTYVYILLPDGMEVGAVAGRLAAFAEERLPRYSEVFLQPLTSIHLHSHLQGETENSGDARDLYLISGIALLILTAACANFVNLSTAVASRRALEVGLRKVVGARRRQIAAQFLGEALLTVALAMGLATALVQWTGPQWRALIGTPIQLADMPPSELLAAVLGLLAVVGGLAGAYAAFHMSASRPAAAFREGAVKGPGGRRLRRALVLFQFGLSVGLIGVVSVMAAQLRHVERLDLGFTDEEILVVEGAGKLGGRTGAFVERLRRHSGIAAVSSTRNVPGKEHGRTFIAQVDGQAVSTLIYDVDYDFIGTMGLELVEGRPFSSQYRGDSEGAMVVNQRFAALFDTSAAVLERATGEAGRVIGVVRDFHVRSLHQPIQPVAFRLKEGSGPFVLARIGAEDLGQVLPFIRATWEELAPDLPFVCSSLRADWTQLYSADRRKAYLVGLFAGLAILVALLGLFALAAFSIERRTKEIAIRKTLGASLGHIVGLLTRESVALLAVASLIAWPAAYWASRQWLDGFAYRIDLGPGYFALGSAAALAIVAATAGWQAVRAAVAQPVEALRSE
ncbi:MAG: FtsX-like permease family protein [Candidatus Latescibacteria bacterium]|nr:FtsX-like permease family protein [Candidatus Latescibacterota bacterium]